jgi:hypothetical protein
MAIVVLAALAEISCGARTEKLTFQVRVADLRKHDNALAKGKRPDELVTVTAPGKLYRPPLEVQLVERRQADWSTPERAVASILSAGASGEVSWIVENFVAGERERVAKQFANPEVAQRTETYYRNIGKVAITGRAEIHGVTLLFLLGKDAEGDPTLLPAPLVKTESGWRQTGALSGDDTYDVVWAALHAGQVQ